MLSMKERRKALRAVSNLPLDIYDSKGQMIVGEGRFTDFSTLGGRMVSRKPLKANSDIRLHVVPVGKPALELSAKVVWTRKKTSEFEYGIRFHDIVSIPHA
jgi:PilZ domain-containing protein